MSLKKPSFRHRLESLPTWALMLLCALYLISPIDAIPLCPVDDWFVFGWTVLIVFKRWTGTTQATRGTAISVAPGVSSA